MIKLTKTVQELGNGGHIYLPKELIGQQVVVIATKSEEEIRKEVLNILFPYLSHVKGVYLHGSYARGEQTPESDIEILVVADKKLSIDCRVGRYDITTTTLEGIKKTIDKNAPLILPMVKEAKAIINDSLIDWLRKEKITKKNIKWYVETTGSALKVVEILVGDEMKSSIPNIVYTLMLRLKGLLSIKLLKEGRGYSNKALFQYLAGNGIEEGKELYHIYSITRDRKRIHYELDDYSEISKLLKLTKILLKEVKKYG